MSHQVVPIESLNGKFLVRKFPDNSQWPLNSFLVSQEKRVLFMPIAKNANTSLKQMFVRLSGHDKVNQILNGNIHINLTSQATGLSLCDYTPNEARERIQRAYAKKNGSPIMTNRFLFLTDLKQVNYSGLAATVAGCAAGVAL